MQTLERAYRYQTIFTLCFYSLCLLLTLNPSFVTYSNNLYIFSLTFLNFTVVVVLVIALINKTSFNVKAMMLLMLALIFLNEYTMAFLNISQSKLVDHYLMIIFLMIFLINNFNYDKVSLAYLGVLFVLMVISLCIESSLTKGIIDIIFGLGFISLAYLKKYNLNQSLIILLWIISLTLDHYGLFHTFNYAFTLITCTLFDALMNSLMAIYKTYSLDNELMAKEMAMAKLNEETLKNQIGPHFLFNSLTVVDSLYQKSAQSGEEALILIKEIMNDSLSMSKKTLVPISQELHLAQKYCALQNLKGNNKVDLIFKGTMKDIYVPPLTLEPLIENALKYAFTKEQINAKIVLKARKIDDKVQIVINDNGSGFDITKTKITSVGLRNTRERIENLKDGQFRITSIIDQGTTIEISYFLD